MFIEREIIGLLGLLVLFLLLILRAPVALAMTVVGIGGNFVLSLFVPYLRFDPYLKSLKTLLWGVVANYELSVVPLFILMGYLAGHSKMSHDLFQGFNALIGRFRGGVAMAVIGSCAGFGAVCGSSLATASTVGRVALPELQRLNYAPRLATGTLAAGGTLGILIPPSVALVIYALIVEASIIKMFQAAIIPGLLAVFFFMLVIAAAVRLQPELAPVRSAMGRSERRTAFIRLLPTALIFSGIIGGLALGLFTPTPAAAVGATLVLLYGIAMRFFSKDRGLDFTGIKLSIIDTSVTAGLIYFILFGAEILKGFFTRSGLPAALATWLGSSGIDPWTALILLLIILIILGCFMDSLTMILVTIPFFWPALIDLNGGDYISAGSAAFGMGSEDLKIWFGIIALVVIELGLITPPVGLNVFVISSLAKHVPIGEIFRGVMPFFCIEIFRIVLLLCFPFLCLFLPYYLS